MASKWQHSPAPIGRTCAPKASNFASFAFGMQEGYSTGWNGTAVVVGNGGDQPLAPTA